MRRGALWIGSTAVGIVAAIVSATRILVVNPDALSTMVWAEDGIFPLCVDKVGPWSCLVDPYAGYLIFLPRVLAIPISWLPLESWAWATNVTAAIVAGVLSGVVFAAVRMWGTGVLGAIVVALLPVTAPIVGFEAVNVYASVYMLLLFTMTVVLATWTNTRGAWWVGVGLLVTALTIPSAIVLIIPILLLWLSRRIVGSEFVIMTGFLVAGLAIQAGVALGADNPRPISITGESLDAWVENIPVALTTLWPGLSFGPTTIFGIFETPAQTLTGWLLALGCLAVGIVCVTRRSSISWTLGILLLSGLAIGAIPTVIGYVNNRYYVVPVLLWAAAGVLGLSAIGWRRPVLASALGIGLLIFLWWPAFGASSWRATASPSWIDVMAGIRTQCNEDIAATVNVVFSPDWPMPHVALTEPTTGLAKCIEVSSD